jgi:predicted amidohydrolase YtcJ
MAPQRTLVLSNIRTMESPGALADWMLVEGGGVNSTGRGPAPAPAREGAAVLDLSGRTVVPALHDTHVHLLGTGRMEVDLDLGTARSLAEALDLIADAARGFGGAMLRAHSFDPDLMADGRYPTRDELDAISTALPIHVRRRDGHSSAANGAALALFGTRPGEVGAEVDSGGRLTGVLRGKAHGDAAARSADLMEPEERAECYRRAAARAAAKGIGVVHALVGRETPACRDVETLLDVMPELPIDVVAFAQTTDVDRVAALGLPRIGGCILLDGSFGSRTAALTGPYADGPGAGDLYRSDDEIVGFFRAAHARGLQIAVHAIGDRAIGQAVACYGAACGAEAVGARHRVEHCEMPSPAHLAAMSRLGLASGVQPAFELFWGGPGGMYEARLGARRASRTNPFRSMLESGVAIAGGSDSYVTPMDPLLGVHAAVNRAAEDERLSVHDALSLFTTRAAWISFDESRRGTLEAGKEASFTVLGADPFTVDPGSIRDIPIEGLFVRGRPVSGRSGSRPRGV